MSYNVAFVYKPHVPGYAGVRTWTSFSSKEEFEQWIADDTEHEVLGQGISAEECIELTRGTPAQSYINAAVHDSFDPETGNLDLSLLFHNLEKVRFAISRS